LGQSPARVVDRLAEWTAALSTEPAGPIPVADFPFREILDHYGVFGRNYAYGELVSGLRELHRRLPEPRTTAERMLLDWLPSTFDQHDGDYDSYLVAPMLERLAAAGGEAGTDAGLDTVLAVLLSDLLLAEGEALAAAPEAPWQRVRTHAALQAFGRVGELAPGARGVEVASTWTRRAVARDDPALPTQARWFAQAMLDELPADARHAVEIAMLPTTPVHDEIMFIRSVQLFELVYRQVVRCLARAAGALASGELGAATEQLAAARRRVEGTPILYRVLTTMSREGFAFIRGHTVGRSAVQSRAYREVERTCAPRPPGPVEVKVADIHLPGPSLEELYLRQAASSSAAALAPIADAMARLDDGWRAMKRTHWGITLKIIGRVPGTGGSTGASYLKTAAERSLFPQLPELAELVERGGERIRGARSA
jgi:tryptophan 2,3-dioxygenase